MAGDRSRFRCERRGAPDMLEVRGDTEGGGRGPAGSDFFARQGSPAWIITGATLEAAQRRPPSVALADRL